MAGSLFGAERESRSATQAAQGGATKTDGRASDLVECARQAERDAALDWSTGLAISGKAECSVVANRSSENFRRALGFGLWL